MINCVNLKICYMYYKDICASVCMQMSLFIESKVYVLFRCDKKKI